MLRNKMLIVSYITVALFAVLTLVNVNRTFELETVDGFYVSYLPNVTGISVYELGDYSNTMKCNLTTVDKIINNMVVEGYFYIVADNSKDNLLDITLSNNTELYRILYNRRTRDYMCLSNPFLKNYVPATYIHE